ncbi:MAG: hypothetical protein ACOVS5_05075 [Oligoflexus sp.]|jgi:hypothetical protein
MARMGRASFFLRFLGWVLGIGLSYGAAGCFPRNLEKYQKNKSSSEVQASPATAAASPRVTRPRIVLLGDTTFRFQMTYERTWDALLDILLSNYNLSIADRTNGLITTEWDTYYLEGKVHRNKLSIRLKRTAGNGAEVTIFNNVERLSQASEGTIGEIWLPTDRTKPEVGRIVQNLAIALQLPPPELPSEMMSTRPAGADGSRKM